MKAVDSLWNYCVLHLCVLSLQFLHMFQQSGLGLCVLQQGSYIKHVIQIGLDLHQQPVALCELQLLHRCSTELSHCFFFK